MMASVAFFAPTSPPLTGASISVAPFSLSCFANSRVALGEIVEWSTTIVPRFTASMIPRSPRITCSTSGVSGTQMKTTSAFAAAAAGLSTHVAPRFVSSVDRPFVREFTSSGRPAFSRWPAIGWPMIPRPMNAMGFDMGRDYSDDRRRGNRRGRERRSRGLPARHHYDDQDEVHQDRQAAGREQRDDDRMAPHAGAARGRIDIDGLRRL